MALYNDELSTAKQVLSAILPNEGGNLRLHSAAVKRMLPVAWMRVMKVPVVMIHGFPFARE